MSQANSGGIDLAKLGRVMAGTEPAPSRGVPAMSDAPDVPATKEAIPSKPPMNLPGVLDPGVGFEPPAGAVPPVAAPATPPPAAPPPADSGIPSDVLTQETPAPAEDPLKDAPPGTRDDPKAARTWKMIKDSEKHWMKEASDRDTRIKEYEAKLAEASKAKPAEIAELAALKQKNEKIESRLEQVALAESRSFRERYDKPVDSLLQRAAATLVRFGGKPPEEAKQLAMALANPKLTADQVSELLADVPANVQGALTNVAGEVADLLQTRETALSDWRATKAATTDMSQKATLADVSKAVVEGTSKAVEQLTSEKSWLYMESKSDPNWNAQRDELIGTARTILRDGKPEELTKYIVDGVASAKYRALAESHLARANKLQAELNKYVGVTPGIGGNGQADEAAPAENKRGAMSPDKWLKENVRR